MFQWTFRRAKTTLNLGSTESNLPAVEREVTTASMVDSCTLYLHHVFGTVDFV